MKPENSGLKETDVSAGAATRQIKPLSYTLFAGEFADQYNALRSALHTAAEDYGHTGHEAEYEWLEEVPRTSMVVELVNALHRHGYGITSVEALNVAGAPSVSQDRCQLCGDTRWISGFPCNYCDAYSQREASPPDTVLPEKEGIVGRISEVVQEVHHWRPASDLRLSRCLCGHIESVHYTHGEPEYCRAANCNCDGFKPLGKPEASSESVETSRQKELLPWTVEQNETQIWIQVGGRQYIFDKHLLNDGEIRNLEILAELHNATLPAGSAPSDNVSAVKTDLGLPGGERAAEHVLQKKLPNESGLWWWLNDDEDSEPIPVSIALSGSDGRYFAQPGQWGWNRFQNVEDMGGWWCPCIAPSVGAGDSSTASGVSAPDSSSPATTVPASPTDEEIAMELANQLINLTFWAGQNTHLLPRFIELILAAITRAKSPPSKDEEKRDS